MDSWETSGKAPVSKNKWEGEDEEEDVLDSWDMEEPEVEQPPPKETVIVKETVTKKKRKERVEEDEEDVSEGKQLTPEEQLAEKLRRQKLQEEADLVLAKEMLGVSPSSVGTLETKEDFDKYLAEIDCKVTACAKNAEFSQFAEQVVTSLCLGLSAADIKRIHNVVGNLHIEKLKMEKGDKGKKNKGKGKAKLRIDEETDYNEFSAYTTDDFDDFI